MNKNAYLKKQTSDKFIMSAPVKYRWAAEHFPLCDFFKSEASRNKSWKV